MAYILQLFDAPSATSVAAAAAHVDSDAPPVARAKVDAFVAGVATCFPDLSDADEDGDDDVNAWPEGLDLGTPDAPVVNLGLKLHFVEPGVLSIIAEHAVRAGLQVLDPQNAMLYRADRVVVDAHGRGMPFRGLTAFAMQAMRRAEAALAKRPRPADAPPPPAPLTIDGVRTRVVQHLMATLAAQGFEHRVADRADLVAGFDFITRLHGEVRQTLKLESSAANGAVVVRATVWLSWAPLAALWAPLLPPVFTAWLAGGDRELAGCRYDFSLHPLSIGPEPAAPLYDLFMGYLDSTPKVDRYGKGVADWMREVALGELEPVRGLAGLADLLLSERHLLRARNDPTEVAHQLGLLALAHLAADPRFENVVRALHENRYNRDHGWRSFEDPKLAHLGAVVDGLRRRPLGR